MAEKTIIGFDARHMVGAPATGLGNYGRTLVGSLAALDRFDLRLYAPDAGQDHLRALVPEGPGLHYCHPRHARTPLGQALWRSGGMVRQLVRDGVRVYHGLGGSLPRGMGDSGIRTVVTIHDLAFLRHPEFYRPADVKRRTRSLRQTLHEADRIVAASECTRRDVCELGDVDPGRVSVVYQGCAPRFAEEPPPRQLWQVRERYDLPDRYVLCVGSIEPRKNTLLAVQALHHLPDDVSLVVVGRQTPYSDQVHEYVLQHRMHDRVQMLHSVPDDDLPSLYRMADCFVYPSCYEGFGLPIVEAISQGLPVVACTGSCLEEVGGPHSLYVSPDDAPAMAHAIGQVLFGAPGRQQRIDQGRQYIGRFRCDDAARRLAELYEELARS